MNMSSLKTKLRFNFGKLEQLKTYGRNRRVILKSYKDAEKVLAGKDAIKLGNNTKLIRRTSEIEVCHFSTAVVSFYPNGSISLDNDGYQSLTTKKRLNLYSPFIVEQTKGIWYVHTNTGVYRFARHMHFDKSGKGDQSLWVAGPSRAPQSEPMTDEERYGPDPDYKHDAERNGDNNPLL